MGDREPVSAIFEDCRPLNNYKRNISITGGLNSKVH